MLKLPYGLADLPRLIREGGADETPIRAERLLVDTLAVIFDMDGTLVDSRYDWRAIHAELGTGEAASLIDALNGLEGAEREAKWRRMDEIERQATAAATLREGVPELLDFLRRRRLATALVTNNSARNAGAILDRFDLAFDLVLTRDDGVWKPSGAPVSAAARRLGVPAERCLKVGDSRYDVAAGREAGCGCVVILHDPCAEDLDAGVLGADLKFRHAGEFLRFLRGRPGEGPGRSPQSVSESGRTPRFGS